MRDKIGKRPRIKSAQDALEQIKLIAADKRSHVLADDQIDWLVLRMCEIVKLANLGLEVIDTE